MLKNDLIVGDIHGYFDLLKQIETIPHWRSFRLVFLGDFIDRGPDSLKTLRYIQKMTQEKQALAIRGDHEEMFLGYLTENVSAQQLYLLNDGETTLKEFLGTAYDPTNIPQNQKNLKLRYGDLIAFLEKLPYFYEDSARLYVHGGIYPEGLRATSDEDKVWLREDYWFQVHQWRAKFGAVHLWQEPIFGHNPTSKTIVTGHTITSMIHGRIPEKQGAVIKYGHHLAPVLAVHYSGERVRYFIDGGSYVYQNLNVIAMKSNGQMGRWWQLH